jgi:hypothetical protein
MPHSTAHDTKVQEQKLVEQTESLTEQLSGLTDEEILILEAALREYMERAMKQQPRDNGEKIVEYMDNIECRCNGHHGH